ncbi:DUF3313 family protein [Roseateles violae]|uniref:DUF3313 family protein n=1 Tax=Roseateles violae TaxID=3058042 RepID=A0ABT8DZA8_9BURK|nr:DUF3313 family protein [Pelomonas sp. PFR6]MDN3922899.1 DUF3313 family protein [Pelomonas sp. PFR6]
MSSSFRIRSAMVAALFLALGVAAPVVHAAEGGGRSADEILSHDGLKKVDTKAVGVLYARPGASLAAYNKVIINPVEVAFSKSWDPKRVGSNLKISSSEREEIRSGVAQRVREAFVETLGAKDGYPVVDQPAPDALLLRIVIANLYINAPDVGMPPRSRSYTDSAGEMTLVLEVFDSETRQVLARVVDRQVSDLNGGQITWTNGTLNKGELDAIAAGWASKLRKSLDRAKSVGKK